MKNLKGLYVDCAEIDQPEGTYRFAKNMVDSNTQGALENEDGFRRFSSLFPNTPIGVIPIQNDFVVFTTDSLTNHSIVLITMDGESASVSTIYTNLLLRFDQRSPIQGEFRKGVNGERYIYWVDDRNPPRYLNIDDTSYVNSIEDLSVFPNISNTAISSSSINDSGGSLLTGALIPISRYVSNDGTTTNWFVHPKVFYITDGSTVQTLQNYDGAIGGINSGKSITIGFTDCDTTFDRIQIGYIQSINGVLNAVQALEFVTTPTFSFNLTGSESTTEVTLDEILTPRANYAIARTITQLAGRLYLANLTVDPLPALQAAALNAKIDYTSSLVTVTSNVGNHKDNLPLTFQPGEVYAFYLGVELKKGGWVYYHIPGRAAVIADQTTVTEAGMTFQWFQVKDTNNKGFAGATTNMGYWENSNEVYPNTEPYIAAGLAGDAVRHHKFPSLNYLRTFVHTDNTVGRNTLPKLDIVVSNVVIPSGIQSQISRWTVFFAKKTPSDSLVVGSDLYHASGVKGGQAYNMGGNFLQDWQTSTGLSRRDYTANYTKARGHSPDLILNPSLRPTYARFEYRMGRFDGLNAPYTGFRGTNVVVTKSAAPPEDNTEATGIVLDFTTSSSIAAVMTAIDPATEANISRIDNFRYVPENSVSNDVNNLNSEGIFAYDLGTTVPAMTATDIINNKLVVAWVERVSGLSVFVKGFDALASPATEINSAYMSYCNLLTSVHNSFVNQELIPAGSIGIGYAEPNVTTLTLSGGDTFLSIVSYQSSTCNLFGDGGANPDFRTDTGVRVWYSYVAYTKNNINFRYERPGDPTTNYHPKTDVKGLFSPPYKLADGYTTIARTNVTLNADAQNVIAYNPDYSLLNTFMVGTTFDALATEVVDFPNTIIYSPLQNEDSKEFSWKTFLAGDRYVITQNRGDIINIKGFRNRELIIHTEDSIFRSRTDVNAGADNESIFFKSANLFELPPEELQPSETGYGGTQHKFSCVMTKYGYFYVNDKQGKVFQYTGDALEEISAAGMRTFFRDFTGDVDKDNPFALTGYTLGFDERINRLIVSKNGTVTDWTISYNPLKKQWVSYHDYSPNILFSTTTNQLFAFKSGLLNIINPLPVNGITTTEKGVFFGGVKFPSYVDIIFNPETTRNKQFAQVEWITEAYPVGTHVLNFNKTFTHITVSGLDSCTGKQPLISTTSYTDFADTNLRNVGGINYFNGLRDISIATGFRQGFANNFEIDPTKLNINMEWYEQRKMNEKFVICRFEYDNVENYAILLLDTKVGYRYTR